MKTTHEPLPPTPEELACMRPDATEEELENAERSHRRIGELVEKYPHILKSKEDGDRKAA